MHAVFVCLFLLLILIYRDPRWGRGQETPGEDPFVNAEYAVNFVSGMQDGDSKYLKVSSCCKHYAVYNMESYDGVDRHEFDAIVTDYDLNDTYLVPFKYCITGGKASSLMCSYNAVNGVQSCANKMLMTDLAREAWGFEGYITSDCGAVDNVIGNHHYTNDNGETISVTFKAGMDLECGSFISVCIVYYIFNSCLISFLFLLFYFALIIHCLVVNLCYVH